MISLRPESTIRYIFSDDPALDREHPDFNWEEFFKTGDPKYIPTKPDRDPTVFTVRPLSRKATLRVLRGDSTSLGVEAVAYGLAAVENLKRGNVPVTLAFESSDFGERLTDKTLDALWAIDLMSELGAFIMARSVVHPQ